MRMWNVEPKTMCRQHLLGEHNETHAFVGSINKGISMKGYIEKGLLSTRTLELRHGALVEEMLRRGYNHKSPLPLIKEYGWDGVVDGEANKKLLSERCPECKKLQEASKLA